MSSSLNPSSPSFSGSKSYKALAVGFGFAATKMQFDELHLQVNWKLTLAFTT